MNIYHIVTAGTWREALEYGTYNADTLKNEGFIHCCTLTQIAGVKEMWFKGISDLLQLEIDPQLLSSDLKYEDSHQTGELFPHIYGPLNLDAVIKVTVCE
ncbi:MAG TPA: DUF952 domain-containing protein [Anaerolineaceae bacterium]|nr:DUF952 domain-containing protein [Anaerolineaceae bacterium]